jgi:hypothetical protein
MNKNLLFAACAVLFIPLFSGCEKMLDDTGAIADVIDDVIDDVMTCGEACLNIDSCSAEVTPPSMAMGLGDVDLGVDAPAAVDCAVNCASDDRVTLGYSDCQIQCITNEACGGINDCWDVTSATYASYCTVETTPVEPAPPATDDPEVPVEIAEDTTSGSADADTILENPAVEESVAESGTDIFFGSTPPDLQGKWTAVGAIDTASNARPVGSPINTEICFFDQEILADGSPQLSYCERGNPATATAPLTGAGEGWTMFLEFPGTGSIIFSGRLEEGTASMSEVDALVTYYHGLEIWEHSNTAWERVDDCACPF